MIRPFLPTDTALVHELYEACHPAWPPKPKTYWWGHPTLVLVVEPGLIVGATSFSLSPPPSPDLVAVLSRGTEVAWGMGVYVHPTYQGKGLGYWLAEERHQAIRQLGVHFFIGVTQPGNEAMIAIFERQGLTRGETIPSIYPSGEAGVVYSGEII